MTLFGLTVTFRLRPGAREAFLPLVRENARASVAEEPGCLRFDVCEPEGSDDEVFLYELYEDPAAFDAHLRAPHFLRFEEATHGMVASREARRFAVAADA